MKDLKYFLMEEINLQEAKEGEQDPSVLPKHFSRTNLQGRPSNMMYSLFGSMAGIKLDIKDKDDIMAKIIDNPKYGKEVQKNLSKSGKGVSGSSTTTKGFGKLLKQLGTHPTFASIFKPNVSMTAGDNWAIVTLQSGWIDSLSLGEGQARKVLHFWLRCLSKAYGGSFNGIMTGFDDLSEKICLRVK